MFERWRLGNQWYYLYYRNSSMQFRRRKVKWTTAFKI
nr:MAG TPA: hypothetical protein [Caudoviricetes sp.]